MCFRCGRARRYLTIARNNRNRVVGCAIPVENRFCARAAKFGTKSRIGKCMVHGASCDATRRNARSVQRLRARGDSAHSFPWHYLQTEICIHETPGRQVCESKEKKRIGN